MGKVVIRGAEARQQVIDIIKNGGTWDEAAQATGFGRDYVRQLSKQYGLHKDYCVDREKCLEMAKTMQYTIDEIREACGYSSNSAVKNAIIKNGLPCPQTNKQREMSRRDAIQVSSFQPDLRICRKCNSIFIPIRVNQCFCNKICERDFSHQRNDIIRKRLKKCVYVDNITLDELYERDKGICYLCGEYCDYSDYVMKNGKKCAKGNYPSRDHIVPISKGGLHSWNNVRLAHIKCNSQKGARYGE